MLGATDSIERLTCMYGSSSFSMDIWNSDFSIELLGECAKNLKANESFYQWPMNLAPKVIKPSRLFFSQVRLRLWVACRTINSLKRGCRTSSLNLWKSSNSIEPVLQPLPLSSEFLSSTLLFDFLSPLSIQQYEHLLPQLNDAQSHQPGQRNQSHNPKYVLFWPNRHPSNHQPGLPSHSPARDDLSWNEAEQGMGEAA